MNGDSVLSVNRDSHGYKREGDRERRETEIKRELIFVIIHSTSKGTFSIKYSGFVFQIKLYY
jgi:hypothetical protein